MEFKRNIWIIFENSSSDKKFKTQKIKNPRSIVPSKVLELHLCNWSYSGQAHSGLCILHKLCPVECPRYFESKLAWIQLCSKSQVNWNIKWKFWFLLPHSKIRVICTHMKCETCSAEFSACVADKS